MNNRLRVQENEQYFQLLTANGQADLPDDFQNLLNLQVKNNPQRLVPSSRSEFDGLYPQAGLPNRYCIQGRHLLLYPNPGEVTLEARGYFSVPALSDAQTDLSILLAYPELYLYGSLKHSAIYLKEDDRVVYFAGLFDKAMREANKAAQKRGTVTAPAIRQNHNVNVSYLR